MNEGAATLVRADIAKLAPYSSARRESKNLSQAVWMDANENPFPSSLTLSIDSLNRYPDPDADSSRSLLAGCYGVRPEQILVTRGADEGIELIIRTFCNKKGESVGSFSPSYSYYETAASMQGSGSRRFALNSDGTWDWDELKVAILGEMKVLFLCQPNNPTGQVFAREDIQKLLNWAKGHCLIVLDEAYIEFCPEQSWTAALKEFPQLLVLRTLSKAWGLAGLRVGSILGDPELLAFVRKVQSPYPIPASTEAILRIALTDESRLEMMRRVEEILLEKGRLTECLQKLSCVKRILPSSTNFLLVEFVAASQVFRFLEDRGIRIRDRSHEVDHCLRITIGTHDENQSLIKTLEEFSS